MSNQPLYRAFCERFPKLPVFAEPWFLDAVCEGGRWDAAIVRNGEQMVGAMPYFLKHKGPFRYLTMPHFTKHLGPCLLPEFSALKFEHKFYTELACQLPKVHAIHQDLHPDVANWLPFYWLGYRQTTRYTYHICLSEGLDKVQEGFNRNIRRNLRKAEQELQVHHALGPEQFYDINRQSFVRQGIAIPYSKALFLRHDAALAAHQRRQIFCATDGQGNIHSAAYLIWDARASYYHLSGDAPAGRLSGAGILLVWEAIRFTHKVLGLPVFDFEGSMMPQVEAIRRQFGARQVPYSRVWKYNSRLFQLLDQAKRR
ncbi:MAG: GNAT family N-acetyltransferase [Phaeodactylibacter sp.]|nr:GNAT family N-acetyltransferase [Phaeodactylibacter sp.]MCB9272714.1 GNAT family N-acetyltransferase [Lewinellaceae bacterium]